MKGKNWKSEYRQFEEFCCVGKHRWGNSWWAKVENGQEKIYQFMVCLFCEEKYQHVSKVMELIH